MPGRSLRARWLSSGDEGVIRQQFRPAAAEVAVRLRACLFLATGFDRVRPLGSKSPANLWDDAFARESPVAADCVVPVPGFRELGRDRILQRVRHPLQHRPDSQPLRRADVHRAEAIDPQLRG